ncbi:hypothetical protein AB0K51_17120 [Kitasatospora sp. NPDC049285]|uniref:hypothetical protein n=1 Tax=Kitasatospora sp. NPDC049285 TaxID=3157096 RepID=UPI003425FA10
MTDHDLHPLARLLADPATAPHLTAPWNALRRAVYDLTSSVPADRHLTDRHRALLAELLERLRTVDDQVRWLADPPVEVEAEAEVEVEVAVENENENEDQNAEQVDTGEPRGTEADPGGVTEPGPPPPSHAELLAEGEAADPGSELLELLAWAPELLGPVAAMLHLAEYGEGLGVVNPQLRPRLQRLDANRDWYRSKLLGALRKPRRETLQWLLPVDQFLRSVVPVEEREDGLWVVPPVAGSHWDGLLKRSLALLDTAAAQAAVRRTVWLPRPGDDYSELVDRGVISKDSSVRQGPPQTNSNPAEVVWAFSAAIEPRVEWSMVVYQAGLPTG